MCYLIINAHDYSCAFVCMYMVQMEIVHYNKGAVEVGEVICDRAKDLQVTAVVMARCAASVSRQAKSFAMTLVRYIAQYM